MKSFATVLCILCWSLQGCQVKNSVRENNSIIDPIEPQAKFPGGNDSLLRFIHRNLKYPNDDVEGTVFVGFTVNEDGSTSNFEIKKGLCEKCDENAIEVLKKMPKWIPCKINGVATKQKFVMPVKFSLFE